MLSTAVSVAAESGCIRGDADGDETVTVLDATCIQKHLASLNVTAFVEMAADVDGDTYVTILDATAIQRKLAGFNDPYHIGERINDSTEPTQPTQDEYELPLIPCQQ